MPEDPLEITVDGAARKVSTGRSIAAALLEGGAMSWRRTRRGDEPRGVFCGIGVCFDCLVTLNGTAGVRACVVEVRPGDTVVTERGSGYADRAV
jgi:hypothetical protein